MPLGFAASLTGWGLVLLLPIVLFFVLLANPGIDLMLRVPREHFIIVSLAALLSLILAIIITWVAARLKNACVLFFALALFSIAGIFSVHGLATPGFLVQEVTVVVGLSRPTLASLLGPSSSP